MKRSIAELLCVPETRDAARMRIDALTRAPEAECVARLLATLGLDRSVRACIEPLARRLASAQRAARIEAGGIDALMREFSLSSDEGVALMCLAEALLRVPDDATADRLIRDRLAAADWQAHVGHSPSFFVNAAAWGLVLGGRVALARDEQGLGRALSGALARGGESAVRGAMRAAMRLLGQRFVAGRTIGEALQGASARERAGYLHSFDMLGEAAMSEADAERYLADYLAAARAVGEAARGRHVDCADGISVKLSALSPRYVWSQPEHLREQLLPRLRAVCAVACEGGIGLAIDAEESDRLEPSMDLFEALVRDEAFAGWDGLGFVVQAYQKRAPAVLDWLIGLARETGRRITVRLVKGAYWDSEIKRAQLDGLADYPVFTRKAHTDLSYLACARQLLDARAWLRPQFATHNAHTVAALCAMAGDRKGGAEDFEFQCLHGMGESLYDEVLADPALRRRVRIYAPVGSHETLLPYLVRRLLENGANNSFVHRVVDPEVSLDELVADPLDAAQASGGAPHPAIPLPLDLYGARRRNASGLDLASPGVRAELAERVAEGLQRVHRAAPLLALPGAVHGSPGAVRNPADPRDIVGAVVEADAMDARVAVDAAIGPGRAWSSVPAIERAACLARIGDALEASCGVLLPLLVREAGKTWPAAQAEVREAVDFCRYYASIARSFDDATHRSIGSVVCISPWNFPLAIFVGQIVGALVAGNPVLAKPAEQTPLVAMEALRIMHAAGVPRAALQLLPGRGEEVGAALVGDERVAGVLFTGSTAVAREIRMRLARRRDDCVFIAETGGQNALIADATALPEHLVADALASAFDSAGQRCSALRLLCVQEEIAGRVFDMLRAATEARVVGVPADLRSDIGPVIDDAARTALDDWIAELQRRGLRVWRPTATTPAGGAFFLPAIVEIDDPALLAHEHFGPVLHVLRYRSDRLDALVDAIHALGYGLTFGVHSRIGTTVAHLVDRVRAGNVYVNRNIVGAVVGVQPFGGEGLSGTGPKAGGPLFPYRLLVPGPRPALEHAAPVPQSPELEALLAWLDSGDCGLPREAAERLRDEALAFQAGSLAGRELVLDGPTGEDNRLRFVPLVRALCVAPSSEALVRQVLVSLASGCRPVLAGCAAARALHASLPHSLQAAVPLGHAPSDAGCDAVLFDGGDAVARAWRIRLAAREGATPPLLRPRPGYDALRLVRERSISINTAAAGGNLRLFALEDDA